MTAAQPTISAPPLYAPGRQSRLRPALLAGLGLSLVVHLVWSLWPVDPPVSPDEVKLTATITEMPAPPTPAPAPAVAKAKPKAKRPPPPAPKAPPAEPAPMSEIQAVGDALPALGPADPAPLAAMAPMPTIEPYQPPPRWKTLPPRLDLAYKVFLGTQGFLIGEATYRFEHSGDAYWISTVAEARGLAALFFRGQGKVESRGRITPNGLQPDQFAIERGSSDRREVAVFDWNAGIVRLHDDKEAALQPPAFDPMTLMWQAYFTPPESAVQTINIVTTRRVLNYSVEREGTERIAWAHGEVDAERWHRKSDDGRIDAYFWLAPDMHYALVKMRVSQTMRGTLEAVLDQIRVDESAASELQAQNR